MKMCSLSLGTWEVQLKPQSGPTAHLYQVVVGMWRNWNSHVLLVGMQNSFPEISLLYSREMETYLYTKTCS